MPKIKINYENMIFYKVYSIIPNVKKIFIGHTTNIIQRRHVLKKQSEIRYSEMFDFINKNGGWKLWRIQEIEKYNECKTYADVLLREKYHYDELYSMMSNEKNGEKEIESTKNDKYVCIPCGYECYKKKHFQQHLTTRKHMLVEKNKKESLLLEIIVENAEECKECGEEECGEEEYGEEEKYNDNDLVNVDENKPKYDENAEVAKENMDYDINNNKNITTAFMLTPTTCLIEAFDTVDMVDTVDVMDVIMSTIPNNNKKKQQFKIVSDKKGEHKCACGNVYKNMSGLCKHRHTCKLKLSPNVDAVFKSPELVTSSSSTELIAKTAMETTTTAMTTTAMTTTAMTTTAMTTTTLEDEIILQLLKDNESMKTFMKEQNNMLKEMMRQINTNASTSSTITTTNNIKQKFNINIFLNEQCKDAINMGDFIKSLKVTFHDLEITRDKSLEESVSTIMLRGLKELDVYKRPIHCTDQKRDVMYIKDEEKWETDDGNVKLKESIGTLSKKQMFTLKELRDSDPEIKTNDEKKDRFITTMNHVCTPIPELSEKKIIKSIGKEIFIDKIEE
jgi:hypothetical protein